MSSVAVKVYQPSETGARRLSEHIANIIDQIRLRAFELSTMHGQTGGNDLDDWFQAEHEFLACQRCEVREEENHFVIEVDAAEFEPQDMQVSLLGNDLMVEGTNHPQKIADGQDTETAGRSIMVRAFLSDAFDPVTIKAKLHEGVLRVTVNKRQVEAAGVPTECAKSAAEAA